ncbi:MULTISPECIES: acyl-CoA thioesterase [Nocardia]|uniref:Acyl-CoA thioesterase 2 n=2 Tax=Nocardia farcinica TaxID=37329 RepID=Q5YYM9_NOCFA|nr:MULTISPECIES: acyl-CoA thioesterase II [Nocardia]MCZ9330013.1 acyl-CoA thioesterase II [Nocardia farcinica]PEH74991.1 acyl-CoA thioesterase II [Nocardia sp. FDAARGOS_372]PFX05536.1 Acyl-CoA thioesterase 2 [Nocardia farcinica]PFX10806.1 Acyl-CoA thioesterase 2 [Nocardia farcinica]UEX24523.1 acyl-CoA thioesterase II [Nocardia farcinica]
MSISLSDSVGAEQAPAERSDLDVLLGLLELDEVEPDVFIGHHPEKVWSRTFGGQLVAQAIMAAGRTVGDRPVHAVNAHFVRGGDPKKPIEYRVVRHRDGRAFANRTVTAVQDDQELFVMLAAFQDWGKGLEHAHALPEVPDPETLPRVEESFQGLEDKLEMFVKAPRPIDMRYTNDPAWILKGTGERLNHNRVWMRADGALPDDPLVHVATLGYSSDTTVLDSILTTHGLSWGLDRIVAATVNHSIWFHRPFRFDDWALYATESPVAAGSRGLATGRFYSRTGDLLATTVQEGLIRHFPSRR